MSDCDGYLTPEGECLETSHPIATLVPPLELPTCAPGEEAQPAGDIYVCGPADPATPEEVQSVSPVAPDELAATGSDPLVGLVIVAGVAVSLGLGLLRWSHDRRSVTHDNHS